MDLLTQGLLGGATALAVTDKKHSRLAALVGFAAALLADADILINASDDPLLNVELHRHFSHALIFIPVGALVAALILWPLLRNRLEFRGIYLYALAGYATAGILDACTSYGTHLLWPFTETRIAWSIVAIIDPVFSLVLLIALVAGLKYCKPLYARTGLALAGAYLLIGVWQHHNALQVAVDLAAQRDHKIERIIVKPTLANLVLWRSIYLSEDRFFVDAIWVGPGRNRIYTGASAPKFEQARDFPNLDTDSVMSRDIERFSKLASDYVVADPGRDNVLTDIRYSMLPTGIAAMWGIDLDLDSTSKHVKFENYRDRSDNARELFIAMLLGRDLPE